MDWFGDGREATGIAIMHPAINAFVSTVCAWAVLSRSGHVPNLVVVLRSVLASGLVKPANIPTSTQHSVLKASAKTKVTQSLR